MIETKYTDKEKKECVNEYINGREKNFLADKYSVSIRTIDRWIKKFNGEKLQLRKAKRARTLAIDIQGEILKVLNNNAIFQGFNTEEWNEPKVIKYINDTYAIKINRRMAQALIEDAKKLNTIGYEERIYSDIQRLEDLGYSVILLDYIKIGRIKSLEVEPLELRKYTADELDVNLVVARASDNIYLDIIVSEFNVVYKGKISEIEKDYRQRLQKRLIVDDKYKVLNKIEKAEGNDNTVFITTSYMDTDKLMRKKSNIKYFMVRKYIYDSLLQGNYEGEDGRSIAQYIKDNRKSKKEYRSIRDIGNFVLGKVDGCVSNVIIAKMEIEKCAKNNNEKLRLLQEIKENQSKRFKIMNNDLIYNI